MNKGQLFLLMTFFVVSQVFSQVGINTANPQNDLHVEGGVRITDLPDGTSEDARRRIVAITEDGDLVKVTVDSVLDELQVPVLAFSAQFGVSDNPVVPFFATCSPCYSGYSRRLNMNDERIILDSPFVNLIDPSTRNANEYFEFQTEDIYEVKLSLAPRYRGNRDYRINIRLIIEKQDGSPDVVEAIRFYGGEPTTSNTWFSIPGTISDTRLYEAGDRLYFVLDIVSVNGGAGRVQSDLATNATYQAQISITKY